MSSLKLYMVLLGCRPGNRLTEQHDIFFGIAGSMKELIPAIIACWPEAKGKMHVDAWREVNYVDGYKVTISERGISEHVNNAALFFINLGGYKQNEFDEFHYKMLLACADKAEAIKRSKQTAFYKHTGFKGANSHIDDKYGVDVDDIHEIQDILPAGAKSAYQVLLEPVDTEITDPIQLGYFPLHKL
ncbi:MAG: hypothetical protein JWQ27_922 [Ferruginibacter sp.]|nr:hypothetical protein [Ferruginibacter sp.]